MKDITTSYLISEQPSMMNNHSVAFGIVMIIYAVAMGSRGSAN